MSGVIRWRLRNLSRENLGSQTTLIKAVGILIWGDTSYVSVTCLKSPRSRAPRDTHLPLKSKSSLDVSRESLNEPTSARKWITTKQFGFDQGDDGLWRKRPVFPDIFLNLVWREAASLGVYGTKLEILEYRSFLFFIAEKLPDIGTDGEVSEMPWINFTYVSTEVGLSGPWWTDDKYDGSGREICCCFRGGETGGRLSGSHHRS